MSTPRLIVSTTSAHGRIRPHRGAGARRTVAAGCFFYVGATFVRVLSDYARRCHAVGARLYLTGVDEHVHARLRAALVDEHATVFVYPPATVIGASLEDAAADARAWLTATRVAQADPPTPAARG